MASNWSAAPGEAVIVSLDARTDGVRVRITSRTVKPAHMAALPAPRIWGSTLVGLAALVLVGMAFGTGAIRPAPPVARAPRPGEPTPTPDTRPVISIGGFVLRAPVLPTPQATGAGSAIESGAQVAEAAADGEANQAVEPASSALISGAILAAPQPQSAPPQPACTNLFGIGCPPPRPTPAPTARPTAPAPLDAPVAPAEPAATPGASAALTPAAALTPPPAQTPPAAEPTASTAATPQPVPATPAQPASDVLVIASPAPRPDRVGAAALDIGPRPGSPLDEALKVASLANEQFNRSLEQPSREPPGPPGAPDR